MKSGLEGRNNGNRPTGARSEQSVSMKSGLEGRNNTGPLTLVFFRLGVSMKSGLEGRNNPGWGGSHGCVAGGLNEVRPRRPEQSVA